MPRHFPPGMSAVLLVVTIASYRPVRAQAINHDGTQAPPISTRKRYNFHLWIPTERALFEIGLLQEATQVWLKAVGLEPQQPFARAALAIGLWSLGETDAANLQYELAQWLDSRYGNPENLRIDIRWTPKALRTLGLVRRVRNKNGPILMNSGECQILALFQKERTDQTP